MNKSAAKSTTHSPNRLGLRKWTQILFLLTLTILINSVGIRSQQLRSREIGAIRKIKFSVPAGFHLQRSRDADVAVMKADAYEGGLFVAASERATPSETDLMKLSRRLVAELFPQQGGFSLKVLAKAPIPKLSVHQQDQFVVKAINANKFVQAEFVLLRFEKKSLLVGLVTQFGSDNESRFLYEVEGTEYSVAGWRGMYELLDSIKRA